jgi:hypothetical protein
VWTWLLAGELWLSLAPFGRRRRDDRASLQRRRPGFRRRLHTRLHGRALYGWLGARQRDNLRARGRRSGYCRRSRLDARRLGHWRSRLLANGGRRRLRLRTLLRSLDRAHGRGPHWLWTGGLPRL